MASPDEIWVVDFGVPFPGEPANRRHAVVVGPPTTFGPGMPFVFVCPITTAHRRLSLHIEIEANDTTGLAHTSYAQCELLRSVSVQRLVERVGSVDFTAGMQVREVIRSLLVI